MLKIRSRGKLKIILLVVFIILLVCAWSIDYVKRFLVYYIKYYTIYKPVKVEENYSRVDKNKNGVPDCINIVNAARKEATNKTKYVDKYYIGGYPPNSEGVCTDVVWRALKGINVNLKKLVDADIKQNISLYARTEGKPDPNIDFRRVPNLNEFFKRKAISLTTKLIPGDVKNFKEWQRGDIVVILKPYQHVAIVSDKRTRDGMPYFIHNTPPHAKEVNYLFFGNGKIAGHYRWKY